MKATTRIAALGAIAIVFAASAGWGDEMMARLSDKDVIALVKTLGQQQKAFGRAIDSKFRQSVLRGPGGEIDVDKYLSDLEVSIKRLGERFTGSYSASTEATEVLTRADFMNSYVRRNPSMRGANEWDVFGASLQQLASVYGTSFPLPENAAIRRIGDGELADAATAVGKLAKDLPAVIRNHTRGMKELADPVKSMEAELKSMNGLSKTLASRIRTGKPASAEARQLIESVSKVEELVGTEGMPAEVREAWKAGARDIGKVTQAFGLQ